MRLVKYCCNLYSLKNQQSDSKNKLCVRRKKELVSISFIMHVVKKLKNGEILVYSYDIFDFYASNGS